MPGIRQTAVFVRQERGFCFKKRESGGIKSCSPALPSLDRHESSDSDTSLVTSSPKLKQKTKIFKASKNFKERKGDWIDKLLSEKRDKENKKIFEKSSVFLNNSVEVLLDNNISKANSSLNTEKLIDVDSDIVQKNGAKFFQISNEYNVLGQTFNKLSEPMIPEQEKFENSSVKLLKELNLDFSNL